ncbi:hypothetical protein VNO80_09071 [Phaseolus coccineus]|uniref:R13L1/DRL21-like LRR repeat region domain-containing protein n=1 Tax=Phaseolus coccineus TaxID=3886 RepID=A0AAN9N5I2_PHACN
MCVLDDILDKCSIHSTKMHSYDGHTSCLSPLHPKDILFRFNIGKRMKDITQRFHDIHQEKSRFNLELGLTKVQTVDDDWRQTSSDITEPALYGRDLDREQIVKFLLEDASNSEDLSVYPIVGNVGVEDVGNKVWNKLYCRSFFQEAKSDWFVKESKNTEHFVVGSKAGCGLAELHSLKLGGTLRIKGLENIPNEWDAKQANLIGKKDLNILHLSWGGSANSEGSNVNVERVLEALQPPSTLKSFVMNGNQGRQLPSWMRSPVVLRDLVEVKLFGCENCEELPPLGKLQHLKRLEVVRMKNVKWIDGESYVGVEEKAFPSLEELSVRNLPKLERLLREEGIEMLPRLSQLTIVGVSNLKFPRLPSIEELHASDIDEAASLMEGVVENMPCLKTFHITMIKGQVVLPYQLSGLGALQTLSIGYWYNLEYFSEHVLEGLTSLRSLFIYSCENLKSLSEGVRHLTCLERLKIRCCSELVTLPNNMSQLTALRTVTIEGCSTLPYGLQCVPFLRTLNIFFCKFTSLPDWMGDITSLEQLIFLYCKELRLLPSSIQRLTNLSLLYIRECPYLKKRCERETGEDWQYIKHIPEIQLFSK